MKKKKFKKVGSKKTSPHNKLLPMANPLTVNKDITWFCFVLFFFPKHSICCALHDISYLYTFFLLFGIPGHLT